MKGTGQECEVHQAPGPREVCELLCVGRWWGQIWSPPWAQAAPGMSATRVCV